MHDHSALEPSAQVYYQGAQSALFRAPEYNVPY